MRAHLPSSQAVLAGVLCLLTGLSGATPTASGPGQDPQQLVIDTTGRMLDVLEAKRSQLEQSPERIYALVRDIVLPHFDFVRMSAWTLGKYWRRASQDQKLRFVRAFRELLVRSYAVALLDYRGQEIAYLPLRGDPASGDVTVRTQVVQPGRAPIAIHYSLAERDGRWRVYDVAVDGISLVANFRTSFAAEIKSSDLEALITRLEERNRKEESNP